MYVSALKILSATWLYMFTQHLEESISPNNVKDGNIIITANSLTILNFLKHKTSKVNYELD